MRAHRIKLGLTQIELTHRVGMAFTTISGYENGMRRNIALKHIVRVTEALEIRLCTTSLTTRPVLVTATSDLGVLMRA